MIAAVAYRVLAAALDPTERWEAVRSLDSFHVGSLSRPTVWVPLLLVSMLGLAAVVAYRRHRIRRALAAAFTRAAAEARLTAAEQTMLARIVEAAETRPLTDSYTLGSAFEGGLRRVLAGRASRGLSREARGRVREVVQSLRKKLGLAPPEAASAEAMGLARDDRVTLAHTGSAPEVGATVVAVTGRSVTARPDESLALRVGGAAVLRQVRGRDQWEFDVSVTQVEGELVRLQVIGTPKKTNLRRFARVQVHRPAHVAAYGFIHEADEPEEGEGGRLPAFAAGTLTEIAGPGLLLEAPMAPPVGERVLVVLEIDAQRGLRGVGVVRRCQPRDGGGAEIAVELTGMSEQEVARLVKETNAAARGATRNTRARAGANAN